MAEDTALRDSHDCGILLQHKIESLEQVERAFVHIDYQQREVLATPHHPPPSPPPPPPLPPSPPPPPPLPLLPLPQVDDHDPKVPVEYKTQDVTRMPPLTPVRRPLPPRHQETATITQPPPCPPQREGKSPKTPASAGDGTPASLTIPTGSAAASGEFGSRERLVSPSEHLG